MVWDVIVVGGRCAGSPLAMLMARLGYRVLLVDAASFPSDTLSTHLIWPTGIAALCRWGVWNRVLNARPGVCHTGFTEMPGGTLNGPWHAVEGIAFTANLRRFKLDAILVDAARAAGAEIRERVVVDGLIDDGRRVCGITGRQDSTGARIRETARVVVGADGRRSTVARLVAAGVFDAVPTLTVTYYGYFADLPGDRAVDELYTCPPREYLFSPTDDGLTVVNLVMKCDVAAGFGRDVNRNFHDAFDLKREVGERLRAATAVDRLRGVLNQPNFYRRSFGPGWVLAGDAAHCKDPIRAQGISDALLDAETVSGALDDWLSGRRPFDDALGDAERTRRTRTVFPYSLCLRAARFQLPSPDRIRRFCAAVADNPALIAELRGLIPGSTRPEQLIEYPELAEFVGVDAATSPSRS